MATPAELTAAGVPKDVVEKIAAAADKRAEQLIALQKQLIGWNARQSGIASTARSTRDSG